MGPKIDPIFSMSNSRRIAKQEKSLGNKRNFTKRMEDNFSPFHFFLCLHGIGFYNSMCRASCFQNLLSLAMVVCVDIPSLYDIVVSFFVQHTNSSSEKIAYTGAMMHLCSLILRFWLYKHRCQMSTIVRKIVKAYLMTSSKILLFRRKIFIMLIVNDLYILVNFCLSIYGKRANNSDYEEEIESYFFNRIKYSIATVLYFFTMGIINFCLHNVSALICIYFFFVTHVIKAAFREYASVMMTTQQPNFSRLLLIHNRITDAISSANKFMHMPLLLSFIYTLSSAFYSIFLVLFTDGKNSVEKCDHVLRFLWSVFNFCQFCVSSSSVNCEAVRIRNLVHKLPGDHDNAERMSLILKLHDNFVGFTILESIVINKSLILAAFGTMFTYGIMFATFNISSKLSDE